MKILLLTLFLLGSPLPEVAHDFHISRTRIEYSAAEKEWQISLHVFIDDLSRSLEEKGTPDLYLSTSKEHEQADEYLQTYLRRYFKLSVNDEEVKWEWLGKETSEDLSAFWIYLFVPDADPNAKLGITNKILLDLYSDQQNMIQVAGANGRSRNFLFHKDYWQEEVTF